MLYISPIPSLESSLKTSLYLKCFSLSSDLSSVAFHSFNFKVFKASTCFSFLYLHLFLLFFKSFTKRRINKFSLICYFILFLFIYFFDQMVIFVPQKDIHNYQFCLMILLIFLNFSIYIYIILQFFIVNLIINCYDFIMSLF